MAISARSMTTWPLVALPWDRKPALLLAAQAVPWADRQLKTEMHEGKAAMRQQPRILRSAR
jgi:hypothetical protein